jgi:predicted CopG family antitoxin
MERSVSAEKKFAESDLVVEKLKLEAISLLSKFKHEKQTFSDILKSQKVVNKKQLDAEAVMTAAQVQHKKDAQASKAAVAKQLKVLSVSYRCLEKVSNANKTKISALNFAQTAWMKTRADLQFEAKKDVRDLKAMKKKLDDQLGVKLDHDLSIQKLRNDSKKLELDLLREKLREKLENKKPAPSEVCHRRRRQSRRDFNRR